MNLEDELPSDLKEATEEAWQGYRSVEWINEDNHKDKYPFYVGFLHGAIWLNRHKTFVDKHISS